MTREHEISRYVRCYQDPTYRMGAKRKKHAEQVIAGLEPGTLLDIGAGRGELEAIVTPYGFVYTGIDPVPYLASNNVITGIATDLPFADSSFEVVCCLDVLEHLVEEDIRPALREMRRVARGAVFLTASDKPSRFGSPDGRDLHISKRPIAEWEQMLVEEFPSAAIEYLGTIGVSPGWLVRL